MQKESGIGANRDTTAGVRRAAPEDAERGVIAGIGRALEQRGRRIDEEIRTYPRPITACDAQFDYLLDERAGIRRAIADTDALLDDLVGREDFAAAIEAYLAASPFIAGDAAQQIRSQLAALNPSGGETPTT